MSALAMRSPTLTQRYFDAWNDRDAAAILTCFASDGTYTDPVAGDGLIGEAIAAYVEELLAAFPDLRFEILTANACGANGVAVQWVMRGTNQGAYCGHLPTGRTIALPGASFIQVSAEGIRSVQSYFDSGAVRRQLGIGASTPAVLGPFSFGIAIKLNSGRRIRPGAVTVTTLHAGRGASPEAMREAGFEIGQDLLGRPGFVSLVAATLGEELTTIAAWDSVAAAQQQRDRRHSEVMAQFFPPALSASGSTTVWAPIAETPVWVRCPDCGAMSEHPGPVNSCDCGARLPEAPAGL